MMTKTANQVVEQPTPEAKKAIEHFVKTGEWPQRGVLPVCIRLQKGLRWT